MSEAYKGKPSGDVARSKKDVGRHGDIKELGGQAGARKKNISEDAGVRNVTGTISQKRGKS